MRILVAGATGVLGRATLPHLSGHDVVGLTRTPSKLGALRASGVEGVVCDVYDAEELRRVVREAKPDAVVNFLTDLSGGPGKANNRIRDEGGRHLVEAARLAGASGLVVESVAFPLEAGSASAVEKLERDAIDSPLDVLILRFGRFWGPGTWYRDPPKPPEIHIDEAGERAASLILSAATGVSVVA